MDELTILGTSVPEEKEVRKYLVNQTVSTILSQGNEIKAAITIKHLEDMLAAVKLGLWSAIDSHKEDGSNKVDGYTVVASTRKTYDWSNVSTPKLNELVANEVEAKNAYDEASKKTKELKSAIVAATKAGDYSEAVKNENGEIIDVIEISEVAYSETPVITVRKSK